MMMVVLYGCVERSAYSAAVTQRALDLVVKPKTKELFKKRNQSFFHFSFIL